MKKHPYTPWFIRLPRRYEQELQALEAADLPFRLLVNDTRRGWEGQVEVAGESHLLRIFYPDEYPEAPPLVFDSPDFRLELLDDRSTFHQLANNSLCLFAMGYGADSWSPEFTVVDVIARYRAFRTLASEGAHILQHYSEDERVTVFRQGTPLYITPNVAQVMSLPGGKGGFGFRSTPTGFAGLIVVAGDEATGVVGQDAPDAWGPLPLQAPLRGIWCRIDLGGDSWDEAHRHPERLASQVRERLGLAVMPWPPPFSLILVDLHEAQATQPDMRLVLSISGTKEWILKPIECVSMPEALFQRVDGALSGRAKLQDCTVVVVGVGSLGSHAALALAKAGVSRFALFDPDRLRLENVCRHVGDLADLGELKVDIVNCAIQRRNPGAEVEAHGGSPLRDASVDSVASGRAFERLLERPKTLVLVTVADDRVERRLNHWLVGLNVPAVYASVLGRGEHGRIFRVVPGETPCYQCILYAQTAHPGYFPRLEAPEGQPLPGRGEYHQPGMPGIGIDVEQIALMTARFALQTLARQVVDGIGYPDEKADHLLWTNHGGWCFDRPQQLRIEPYSRVADCAVCGSGSADQPLSEVERQAHLERSKRLQDPARLGGVLL